jgi:hypothetical protein
VDDVSGVAARCRQGELQRISDVAGAHAGAELPGDDEKSSRMVER